MNNRNILLKRIYLMLTMLIGVANLQLSIFNCQLGVAYAQDPEPAPAPKIGGNVYGGGNQGNVDGSTKVTLRAGDIGVRPVGANGKDANPTQGLDNPKGKVFGGARMANVGGNTFVNVDGENASGYILANYVYGGNDIAGTIGSAAAVGEEMPTELTAVKRTEADENDSHKNAIDNTWSSYVRVSTPSTNRTVHAADDDGNFATSNSEKRKEIYIGQLFGGGNGAYFYSPQEGSNYYIYNTESEYLADKQAGVFDDYIATQTTKFYEPSLLKTYLEVVGGSIVYAYGGGNNVTVEEETVIHVNNPSKVVNHIEESLDGGTTWNDLLVTGRFLDMGINTGFSYPSSGAFQIGRFFGGNNSADMAIRPKWNLQRGKIRNLYSGGNKGDMTHPNGIYIEIPEDCFWPVPDGQKLTAGEIYYRSNSGDSRFTATGNETCDHSSAETTYYGTVVIDNLFGGCRMADVRPQNSPKTWNETQGKYDYHDVTEVNNDVPGTKFPRNLAARTIVRGGDVNNVYGGNDVRGRVYFGNAVGIYTSVRGEIYGGGNGNYPYTDNPELENDPVYGDLYYNPTKVLQEAGITASSDSKYNSVTALNEVRPNAEQVSILLRGTEEKPTIIHGGVYVGGNCATLKTLEAHENLPNYPLAELKMGSYVMTENIFLGNNGEGMVTTNAEERTQTGGLVKNEGVLRMYPRTNLTSSGQYNSITLQDGQANNNTDEERMRIYMEGVAMDHIPSFLIEDLKRGDPQNYIPYTSYVGSLFYGGNRGSMTYSGTNTIDLENMQIYLYDKLVGGCNNANVEETAYNTAYAGGILGHADTDNTKDEVREVNGKTAYQRQHKDRIEMNLSMIKIKPMRWNDTFEQVTDGDDDIENGKLKAGETYYATELRSSAFVADGEETVASPATYYRLKEKGTELVWNTAMWDVDEHDFVPIGIGGDGDGGTTNDNKRRLLNGNVYGGCYTSGHVNGNIVINIENDLINRSENFAVSTEDDEGNRTITGARNSGVILDDQGDDVMTVALTVFGGGSGADTEIWGSTTVNHHNGYCFQIFGGGEEGMVGKAKGSSDQPDGTYNPATGNYTTNGKYYTYDSDYSTYVSLKGPNAGYSEDMTGPALAETEYIYGAGSEGDVCGDSYVHLGNGRVYDVFGGASNAEILGGTELHIGCEDGFPWIRDNVYGGNDFGGTIRGSKSHLGEIRRSNIDGSYLMFRESVSDPENLEKDYALAHSSTYVKYIQGRVDSIFGGCYGYYEYKDRIFKEYTDADGKPLTDGNGHPIFSYPHLDDNSFVHFQPVDNPANKNNVGFIFGGSEGLPGHPHMSNTMQEQSYVLVDDYQTTDDSRYVNVDIYGGGAFAGLGSQASIGGGRTMVDLYAGKFNNIYGGSNQEGLTGYTRVNVPKESTIQVNSIFGGGKGYDAAKIADNPALQARFCDHYVTCVDFRSRDAIVTDAIYGGNHNCRVAFDTYVNMCAPPYTGYDDYTASVYGGGYGSNTVSGRTNIYMNEGSDAYKVFGGGRDGDVFNFESLKQWLGRQFAQEYERVESDQAATIANATAAAAAAPEKVQDYGRTLQTFKAYIRDNDLVVLPTEMPSYYDNMYTPKVVNSVIGLVDTKEYYNTNVHILQGGNVNGYAYGGGYGEDAVVGGTTYVELKGGNVDRDIYGGGEGGTVQDYYGLAIGNEPIDPTFVASTNVYVEGGMVRNVYGGGYKGHVGKHDGDISTIYDNDIPAEANVTIGIIEEEIPDDDGSDSNFRFHNGVPAILRNVYGGGEGGSVYGTSNVLINNGYIGYRYNGFEPVPNKTKLKGGVHYYTPVNDEYTEYIASGEETANGSNYYQFTYAEELDDKTPNAIELAGNVFGGGYVVNSFVDNTNVTTYGGTIRGSLYGGGEVGPIGRGTMQINTVTNRTGGKKNNDATIFKAGHTHVRMFNGLVKRNVFGGGRGKDSWGGDGTLYMGDISQLDLDCKGFVFGQTEVDIFGGEVGTDEGLSDGYGNVFGGGDEGRVYSAYELADGKLYLGQKTSVDSERYDGLDEGYYYKSDGADFVDDAGTVLGENAEKHKTEDCKVLVEPWLQVKDDGDENNTVSVTYTENYNRGDEVPANFVFFLKNFVDQYPELQTYLNKIDATGKAIEDISFTATFEEGDYVPTSFLNTLGKKSAGNWLGDWTKLDAVSTEEATDHSKTFFKERGVIIHNAVFAGGNMPPGGGLSANTKYVFGNATATVHDVYHRDLITIGTGHTGGLYGDGNLTLVDGYRGLNITNYGTDFYAIDPEITITQYNGLPPREKAYYELRYKCVGECRDKYETVYKPEDTETDRKASTITTDELELLFVDGTSSIIDPVTNKPFVISEGGHWIPNPALVDENNEPLYWVENGVCSRYAGRLMNTIQRADFCGVFGSRMVMQGARDRVPETVDHTNYTINRVREVSLNKKISVAGDPATITDNEVTKDNPDYKHGNYFGIYSQVNYLGALTSDVDFGDYDDKGDIRVTDSKDSKFKDSYTLAGHNNGANGEKIEYGDEDATFYNWKHYHYKDRLRNNGTSHNLLALASGVYLELTTEKGTGKDLYEKDWGLITGVVELDLINVQPGMGGGFVYAKNVHGKRVPTGKTLSTLTELNRSAVTNKFWDYETDDIEDEDDDDDLEHWQTSGNFVHSTQTIIDDCYNKSGKYLGAIKTDGTGAMPAHYWYIRGQVYVYDQYISAYTGSPNAYSETVEMPLTISSTAYGKLTLVNVQPNLYAYYSNSEGSLTKLTDSQKLNLNAIEYQLNDPIDFWEWWKLSPSEKELFVPETMVSVSAYKTSASENAETIAAGQVLLPGSAPEGATTPLMYYENFKANLPLQKNYEGTNEEVTVQHALYDVGTNLWVPADEIYHPSNNVSHGNGYILTYEVNNPSIWDKWYTEKDDKSNDEDEPREKNQTGGTGYEDSPTYRLKTQVGEETITDGKVLGQRAYEMGEIIPDTTYNTYNRLVTAGKITEASNGVQAKFEPAYIVTGTIEDATNITTTPQTQMTLNPGVVLAKSQFTTGDWPSGMSGKVEPAYICTSTLQVSATEFVTVGTCMTEAKRDEYISEYINTTGLDDRIETLLTQKITEITAARITEIKNGKKLTSTEETALGTDLYALNKLLSSRAELTKEIFVPAYYCTKDGNYAGNYYELGKNYRGLETWSSMSEADRNYFTFNYDALNLLIDPTYSYPHQKEMSGGRYQYDGEGFTTEEQATNNPAGYSLDKAVDYIATFDGTYKDDEGNDIIVSVNYAGTETRIDPGTDLTPQEFEALPNEKRHYAQISVTAEKNAISDEGVTKYRTYVVKQSFVNRDGPYAVGQTLTAEEYSGLASEFKTKVTRLTFDAPGTYYFCREEYTIGEGGTAVSSVGGVNAEKYNKDTQLYVADNVTRTSETSADVPVEVGLVIGKSAYTSLVNKQLGFSIHGTSPKELSTLYVTRESDIKDLSKEKIITVVYQYNYEESNESGTQITPVSEYHVLNIHINFKSGIPFVEDISAPDIVLPGYGVTMRAPNVTPGAYEVVGRGWELFSEERYAENHTNGIEYTALTEPLYWYQDGYYIAYYAKTYLGKTYSNYVPVSVANYHDLKKVMDDKEHHLHVDYNRAKLKRDSKIYINNYTGEKDGVDLLKDFYDLSLVSAEGLDLDQETGVITNSSHPFVGHAPLNISEETVVNKFDGQEYSRGVKAGTNLEFYLRTDIDHTGKPWTPIGSISDDNLCFKGNLHGDGYTISGMSNSLFENLCGSVYNLGVTGSFNTAGVVNKGTGYVESAWVKTSATTPLPTKPNAVFGNPTATDGRYQLVNSYFLEDNKGLYNTTTTDGITTSGGNRGKATAKSASAYYNGELAYDLNNFYLYKRYNDNAHPDEATTYKYYKPDLIDPLTNKLIPQTGTYAENAALCSSGCNGIQYVEERFADGDFRYAAGTVPGAEDVRHYEVEIAPDSEKDKWYPIWPDDYLFFGQKLTYGYSATDAHQDVPTAIARSNGRLSQNSDANRVYRAPAYFRPNTSEMSMAYFNPEAYLLAKSSDGTKDAYPGMTAIDFAGHYAKPIYAQYGKGTVEGLFYPPLLDDDGLTGITTRNTASPSYGETQNLLVYAPAEIAVNNGYANKQTFDVLTYYFKDPKYSDYYVNDSYRRVGRVDPSPINGHIVQSDLIATDDHLLVDKQDFSCPIEYSFDNNHLMWHQRLPDNYIVPEWNANVRSTKGWEGVSLPFTAELVSTTQKGEITHFFDGSDESKNGTGAKTKIGHEYWLRQYRDISEVTGDEAIREARFTYPTKQDGDAENKTVTNTFLWDYYYKAVSGHDQHDYHNDIYPDEYYSSSREYTGDKKYAMLTRGTPYIIGFPGNTYYEFDLSGTFHPTTTADPNPSRLEQQTITFASEKGFNVGISFNELADAEVTQNGYTFKPSYLNEELPTGTFVMNTDGNAYTALSDVPTKYNTTGATYATANAFADAVTEAGALYTDEDGTIEAGSWTEGTTYYKRVDVKEQSDNDKNKVTPSQFAFRPYFNAVSGSGAKEFKGNLTRSIIFNDETSEMFYEEENDDISNTGDLFIRAKDGKILVTSTLQNAKDITIVTSAGAVIDRYTIEPGDTKETRVNASGVYIVNNKKLSVKVK